MNILLDLILLSRRRTRFPFVKAQDAWSTVLLFDLAAIPLTLLLSRAPLRGRVLPDHLSMLSLLASFIGLVMLTTGIDRRLAVVFFAASIVFDCTDGKLARNLGLRTPHGAVTDAVVDLVIHGPGFSVIAIWSYQHHGSTIALALSLLMAAYFAYSHLTDILRQTGNMALKSPSALKEQGSSRMSAFLADRGLALHPFGPVEACFIMFPIAFVLAPECHQLPVLTAILLLLQKIASKTSNQGL